jgi:hypothetical protein
MKSRRMAVVFAMLMVATTMAANAQTNVFVPGTASGYFGWVQDRAVPFVQAVTVTGPVTITVTYVNGTVTDCCGINTGPNGVVCGQGVNTCSAKGDQSPLQEAKSIAPGKVGNMDALIGVFVPAARVNRKGFTAIDGTKGATPVGIMPGRLFFIGTGKTFSVKEAGTLFLGINDWITSDNGGGFNVTVSVQ